MIAQAFSNRMTPAEYLAFEEKSSVKHEYVNGEVRAMAGSTDSHNRISINAVVAIDTHLEASDCQVYIADMKAQLDACNCYYYPDLLVTCDPTDRADSTCKRHAKLIVEILSKSTEAFDRGDKFIDYRTLESLEEYVLISTTNKTVEVFRRSKNGLWTLQTYQKKADDVEVVVELKSIGLKIALSALYRRVELAPVDRLS